MFEKLLKGFTASISLGFAGYIASDSLVKVIYYFWGDNPFGSIFSSFKLRLTCFGIGVCLGVEGFFGKGSLLRALIIASIPAWMSGVVAYELEIEPPPINVLAGMIGAMTGGLSGVIAPGAVNWFFLLCFIITLWLGETVFIRASSADAFSNGRGLILVIAFLSIVFLIPPSFIALDALAHAAEYDDAQDLPGLINKSFFLRHMLTPTIIFSSAAIFIYAFTQRLSFYGEGVLKKIFDWVIGAKEDGEGKDRRGAKPSVKEPKIKRSEVIPPPEH